MLQKARTRVVEPHGQSSCRGEVSPLYSLYKDLTGGMNVHRAIGRFYGQKRSMLGRRLAQACARENKSACFHAIVVAATSAAIETKRYKQTSPAQCACVSSCTSTHSAVQKGSKAPSAHRQNRKVKAVDPRFRKLTHIILQGYQPTTIVEHIAKQRPRPDTR